MGWNHYDQAGGRVAFIIFWKGGNDTRKRAMEG